MQQPCTKALQDDARLGGKGDRLGTVLEIKIWPYYQMVLVKNRIRPKEWDA